MVVDIIVFVVCGCVLGTALYLNRLGKNASSPKPIPPIKPIPPMTVKQHPPLPAPGSAVMKSMIEDMAAGLPPEERKILLRGFYTANNLPMPEELQGVQESAAPVADDECPECGKLFVMTDDYICADCRKGMS